MTIKFKAHVALFEATHVTVTLDREKGGFEVHIPDNTEPNFSACFMDSTGLTDGERKLALASILIVMARQIISTFSVQGEKQAVPTPTVPEGPKN